MPRWLTSVSLAFVVVTAAACASHLHNASDKALAEQAQKQLQTVIKAEQERLAAITANHRKIHAEETRALHELEDPAVAALSRQVLRVTWKQFRSDLGTYEQPGMLVKRINDARDEILKAVNLDFADARLRDDQAKNQQEKAASALAQARGRLTRWNRRVATFEKLIEVAPAATALSEVKDFDGFKTTAKSLLASAGAESVTYTDATGTSRTTTLKEELDDLLDESRALRNGDGEAGAILAGIKDIVTPQAPGLVVTVASLAKDLAEAERTRTLSGIASLERRLAVVKDLDDTLTLAKELSRAGAGVKDAAAYPDETRVRETIVALAKSADAGAAEALRRVVEAIQKYVAVAGPLTARARVASREDAYLRHVQSIEESANAVAQHQALVTRGLEGIATYHAGGMKPEQVADLLHKAAQLILLGVIAGGQ
jgi:hypothetical protein